MAERTQYAAGTPSYVDLSSTNVDAAKQFYAATFGWEYVESPTPNGPYSMATTGGKAAAGLMAQQPEQAEMGMPSMWSTFVTVDDAEQAVATAEAAGGQIHAPVMDVMEAGRMAVIGDPTGAVCCVWEAREHIGAQVVNEHGALTWTALHTGDQAAAADFYGRLFGWEANQVESPTGPSTMFMLDGAPIASAHDLMGGAPPHWSVYFAVDDCDSCAEAVTGNGGRLMMEPTDMPPGRMSAAMDPTGAAFNVIQLNPDFDPTASA